MKEYRISSISDFVNEISRISPTLIKNETLSFRGQPNKDFQIIPYIARFGLSYEKDLIRQAKIKYPSIFKTEFTPIQQLSVLQHYGIPTRLLDITKNSLVALYFACIDEACDQDDGSVIIFKHKEYGHDHPYIESAIANTCMVKDPGDMPLSTFLERSHINKMKSIYFVHLPSLLYRQNAQSGNYIIFANDVVDGNLIDNISPMDTNDRHIVENIIIPKEIKSEILRTLQYLGITEENLFPENIDKGCDNIKRRLKKNL